MGTPVLPEKKGGAGPQPGRSATPHPLDHGSGTVLNERPSLVDPVALELCRLLEDSASKFQDAKLEVEARLGVVERSSTPSGASPDEAALASRRLDLPLSSEALLRHCRGFSYRFSPGLSPEAFVGLSEYLDRKSSESTPEKHRIECGQRFEHTVDIFYSADVSAYLPQGVDETFKESKVVRVSIPKEGKNEATAQATVKVKIGALDLYTGRRLGEHGPAVDLRVAVAAEVPIKFTPAPHHTPILRREKLRKSYHFPHWVIDVSTVMMSEPQARGPGRHEEVRWRPPVNSNEVELELDGYCLGENLEAKMDGRRHKLWELLSDFLFTARDLAVIAGETSPLVADTSPLVALPNFKLPLPELLDERTRKAFTDTYVDEGEPVVGHYMYRLASSSVAAAEVAETEASKRQRTC